MQKVSNLASIKKIDYIQDMRELSLDTLSDAIKSYLEENPEQTVRKLAAECGVSYRLIYGLLSDKGNNPRLDVVVKVMHTIGYKVLVLKDW